jgi:predicted nucleic acid-binding protein
VRNVTPAFWDASAVVPLCIPETATPWPHRLQAGWRPLIVWWGTPIDVRTALARTRRETRLSEKRHRQALTTLERLRESWREILPSDRVRDLAAGLAERQDIRAGDALQLAAAIVWCHGEPHDRVFFCLDRPLALAAEHAGFTVFRQP